MQTYSTKKHSTVMKFETVIKETDKGLIAKVIFPEVTITSFPRYFQCELDAKQWILEQLNAQNGCFQPTKKALTAAAIAIALILPSLPALAQYTPPPNGGPTSSGATGTR